jgi:hypothetical protein
MRRRGRRYARPHPWLPVAIGVLGAFAVMLQTSDALFTATTSNAANSFSTGSVAISDNSAGTALFAVTGMKPGATGVACIKVSYTGSLASTVKVYATGETATNALDTYLTVQIEEGSSAATAFPSCTGFVTASTVFNAALNTVASTYGTGYGTWAPSTGAAKDYRITYTLSGGAPATVVNSTASATITWEAQNS